MTEPNQAALLPCPFCGGDGSPATVQYSEAHAATQGWGQSLYHYVSCVHCGSNTRGLIGASTPEAAREKWNRRAAQEKPAPESVPARGYAALGTGQYAINHSRAGYPAELCISLASDEDKSGNRQVGESRDNPPDSEIRAEDMLIRIAFTSERGLFALEDQLAWVRRVHFPESAPAQHRLPENAEADFASFQKGIREDAMRVAADPSLADLISQPKEPT